MTDEDESPSPSDLVPSDQESNDPAPSDPPISTDGAGGGVTSEDTASDGSGVERSPHDELVKAVLSSPEEAISLLQTALPAALSERIDWPTLKLAETEYVDHRLTKRFNDLLFVVHLKDSPDDNGEPRRVYIDVMFEHQSTNETMMVLRVLGMKVRRVESLVRRDKKRKTLPIVVPVVLYQGEGAGQTPWRSPTRYSELLDADEATREAFAAYIPDFEFVLDDLTQQSFDALLKRGTDVAVLMLALLKGARSRHDLLQLMRRPEFFVLWQGLQRHPRGLVVLMEFLTYLYRAGDSSEQDLEEFAHDVGELAEQAQMTTAQQMIDRVAPKLIATGREEGRQEGRQEGLTAGKAGTVKHQISLKFFQGGTLDGTTAARLDAASTAELDRWTARILTAQSLDELFAD